MFSVGGISDRYRHTVCSWIWGSLVNAVTGLLAKVTEELWLDFQQGHEIFLFSEVSVHAAAVPIQPPFQWVPGLPLSGVK